MKNVVYNKHEKLRIPVLLSLIIVCNRSIVARQALVEHGQEAL